MRVILALILALTLTGCATGPVAYETNAPLKGAPKPKFTVAVADFENIQPTNDSNVGIFKGYVPLWFYTTIHTYREDGLYEYSTDNPQNSYDIRAGGRRKSFSQCLADDLAASTLFKKVGQRDWEKMADEHDKYDFILSGKVLFDRTDYYLWPSLGLGPIGMTLSFILPYPAGRKWRVLRVEYELSKPDNPSFPVWRETVEVDQPLSFMFGQGILYIGPPDEDVDCNLNTPYIYKKQMAKLEELLAKGLKPDGAITKALQTER
jgi:hypothetical protein